MKNKTIKISIVCLMVLLILTGCSKEVNNDANKDNIVTTIDNNKLSEEDQIWIDAQKDEIYNQKITIKSPERVKAVNDNIVNNELQSRSETYEDFFALKNNIDVLEKIKDENKFAKEFLNQIDKTNIVDICSSGTDLEKYLLYTYLNIRLNHYEGIGKYSNWITDNYKKLDGMELLTIYSKGFDGENLVIERNTKKTPYFVFGFKSDNNEEIWVKVYAGDSYFPINYYDSFDAVLSNESSKDKLTPYMEIDSSVIDRVIRNNNEFLSFYIKYKEEYYYPKYDNEHGITGQYLDKKVEKKDPKIGMNEFEVLNSTWGEPKKKNITETQNGKHEQWVYSNNKYIYFENGIVTSIQKSEE